MKPLDIPQMKKALFASLEALPVMCEWYALEAKQKRAQYVALVKEGFTEAQAIELLRPRA